MNLISFRFILEGVLEEALRQKKNDASGKIGPALKNEKTSKKEKNYASKYKVFLLLLNFL